MKKATLSPQALPDSLREYQPKHRLFWYVDRLTRHPLKSIRISEAAKVLDVDKKTVRRGLQDIADLFQVSLNIHDDLVQIADPLGFDRLDLGRTFPFDDVFLFFLKVWDATSLVPFDRALLASVRDKLKDVVSLRVEELIDRITFHPKLRQKVKSLELPRLLEAFIDNKKVKFQYESLSRGATQEVVGDPLKLLRYGDDWYVLMDVGIDQAEIRPFRWTRVNDLVIESTPCQGRVTQKMMDEVVDQTYGIFFANPEQAKIVRLAFRGEALPYVESFRFVGEVDRHRKDHEDETLEVDLRVYGDQEVISDALGWGADCEVVSPPETRLRWQKKIRELGRWDGV